MIRHRRLVGVVLSLAAAPASGQVFTTDASASGTVFNPGIRGQAAPATPINRSDYPTGVNRAYEAAGGASIRGVAGGLEADTFNWKTRNYDPTSPYNYYGPRAGTLDYLRASRDNHADLYITANIRGLVKTDATDPANLTQTFYDTSIPTLANLAADWVRYTNHIVPTYRQGQTIADPRDKAILDSLAWSSPVPGDNFDKLLRTSEAATPKVKYWEIGNEPRVGLSSSYKVSNSYTFFASNRAPDATHKTDFNARYKAITDAMLAEDPTIKVGPAMQWLSSSTEQDILSELLQRQSDGNYLQVDFIGYHPYQKLNEQTTTAGREAFLRGIYTDHLSKVNGIRNIIGGAGRDPNSIALVASEHNVSNYTSNETVAEANMAHALGNTETVFSFARLGLQGAHYWLYPSDQWDGTKFPVHLANEKLRDHMGDTILSVAASNTDNLHLYTTKTSATGELAQWGLNFSNTSDVTRSVPIINVGGRGKVTLYRLGNPSGGTTTLDSAIIPSYWAGGAVNGVAWTTSDLTGTRLDTLSLTYKASTLTLLVVDPWRQIALPGDVNADGVINASDTAFITTNNGQNEKNWWQGDVTGDGLVDSRDAAIVAANQGLRAGTKWNRTTGGSWTTSSNWTGSATPNSSSASAYFGSSVTSPASINATSNVSLTQLVIDNPNTHTLSASGAGAYTLTGSSSSAVAKVFVVQGSHAMTGSATFARSTNIDVAGGAALSFSATSIAPGKTVTQSGRGTLTISGAQAHSSGAVLTNAAGTLNLNTNAGGSSSTPAAILTLNVAGATNFNASQTLAALNVQSGGVARVTAAGPVSIKTAALNIASTGAFDLTDDKLIIDYAAGGASAVGQWNGSQYTGISGLIASGRAGGTWNGFGLRTSMPAAANGFMTLAIAEASDVLGLTGAATATWSGQSVDATAALVTFTKAGDLNLDGTIDATDFARFNQSIAFPPTKPTYSQGDINYDGLINAADQALMDAAYYGHVPEPQSILLCISFFTIARRRTRPRRDKQCTR